MSVPVAGRGLVGRAGWAGCGRRWGWAGNFLDGGFREAVRELVVSESNR